MAVCPPGQQLRGRCRALISSFTIKFKATPRMRITLIQDEDREQFAIDLGCLDLYETHFYRLLEEGKQ